LPPVKFRILHAAPEHVGLGTGTQLGLAVARALLALAGKPEPPIAVLAALAERGLRSGIGLHGFVHGGLLVDGGKPATGQSGVPPLLCRLAFPAEWGVLVVVPDAQAGLHGLTEVQAFAQLPPIPEPVTDRLCRLVLLGILPAVAERALDDFGASLDELQHLVGECFAPAQGGAPVRPELEAIARFLRSLGVRGVGQSSWGPTLYGFSAEPPERRAEIVERLRQKFDLGAQGAFWTEANQTGSVVRTES
jgi:beta-RFAP synthase